MKRFGALFDLDGVLIDSESLYTVFWSDMERRYPTGDPDYAYSIKGMTLSRILLNYPENLRQEVVRAIHDYEQSMIYPVMPGVYELLGKLRAAGAAMAIVTSSDKVKMDYLYRQQPRFAELFDIIIDGSMVTRSKPDPQGYLMAAEKLGIAPKDCLVFEDSMQGLQAGRASGARVIGMASTFPAERVAPLADVVLTTFEGVELSDLGL